MPIHSTLKRIRVFTPVLAVLFLVGACVSTTKADPLFFKNVTAFQNNNLTQVDLFNSDGTTLIGPKLNFSVDIYGVLSPGQVDTLRITYLEVGSAPQVQEFQIPLLGVQPPFTLFFTINSTGATRDGVPAVLILDLLNSFPDFEIPGGGRQGERLDSYAYSFKTAQVPEPITVFTFGSGLVALGYKLRRKKK